MLTDDQMNDLIVLAAMKQQELLASGQRSLWTDPANGRNYLVHPPEKCAGEHCVFHNPTKHQMSDRPINVRETGLIERVCEHGVGHPDPDSVDYLERTNGQGWSVHGCDMCCFSHPR